MVEVRFLTLEDFAKRYDVKVRKDECGDVVIFGRMLKRQPIPRFTPHRPAAEYRYGHQIYDYGDGRFGLLLMFDAPTKWTNAQRKLTAAGFTIKQSGTSKGVPPKCDRFGEGIALFDPANSTQSRLALKLAGVRFRRHLNLTAAQRAAIAQRLKNGLCRRREGNTPPLPYAARNDA